MSEMRRERLVMEAPPAHETEIDAEKGAKGGGDGKGLLHRKLQAVGQVVILAPTSSAGFQGYPKSLA